MKLRPAWVFVCMFLPTLALTGCSASVTAGGAKASTEHVVDRPTVTTRTLEGTNIDPAVAQAFFNLGKKK